MAIKSLTQKAVSGAFWSYLTFGLGKLLVLVSTGILARLLTPNEFGIVGFATVAMTYLAIVQDLGLSSALIQRQEDIEQVSQSVFTWNLAMSVVLTAVSILAAPYIATYFIEEQDWGGGEDIDCRRWGLATSALPGALAVGRVHRQDVSLSVDLVSISSLLLRVDK